MKSAKHILLTAEDIDLALLSVRNTSPAGHSFSPAQRLFGRALRTDIPQSPATLVPSTPSRDIVIGDHIHRKEQQKRSYDKRAGPPLPEIPPGTYVYAKPRPTSTAKAWIPGVITGSAGPRSYTIQTGKSRIRRNRVQIRLAPDCNASTDSPSARPQDKYLSSNDIGLGYRSSSLQKQIPKTGPTEPQVNQSPTTESDQAISELESPSPSPVEEPKPAAPPRSPDLIVPETVTRSGRVIRKPTRFLD